MYVDVAHGCRCDPHVAPGTWMYSRVEKAKGQSKTVAKVVATLTQTGAKRRILVIEEVSFRLILKGETSGAPNRS